MQQLEQYVEYIDDDTPRLKHSSEVQEAITDIIRNIGVFRSIELTPQRIFFILNWKPVKDPESLDILVGAILLSFSILKKEMLLNDTSALQNPELYSDYLRSRWNTLYKTWENLSNPETYKKILKEHICKNE